MPARESARSVIGPTGAYFTANVVVLLAGVISMPIMTRLLSREEYGLLTMAFAMVTILGVFAQLGFPQTTTRFYTERSDQGPASLHHFCDTMLGGALATSLLVGLAAVLGAGWIADGHPDYARCLRLGALVVMARGASAVLFQVYRAEERVTAYAAAQIIGRYGTLVLAVLLLLVGRARADEVIIATAVGEGLVACGCVIDLRLRRVLRWPRLSWSAARSATAYGVPLALAASASSLMDYGDRFLIERQLGLGAVAAYSVPYDLADRLTSGLFMSVRLAVIPIIFRLWTREGATATSTFVSQLFSYLVALAIPLAALLLILRQELIVLLASNKYADSADLLQYLIPGVLLGQLNFVVAAGLTIEKNTIALAVITFLGAALKLGLNLLLLPRWGLTGAAVATTLAYVFLLAVTHLKARQVLPLRVELPVIAKSLLATAVMATLLIGLGPLTSQRLVDLAIRSALGVAVAVGSMSLLDAQIRARTWGRR